MATAKEAFMQLALDDGVAGRGHRKNMFNRASKKVGAWSGYHKNFKF